MARTLVQHFTDWCREKGDAEYEYGSISDCAMCQFLNANGYTKEARAGGSAWYDRGTPDQRHEMDCRLKDALVSEPHTFAALADRLSA